MKAKVLDKSILVVVVGIPQSELSINHGNANSKPNLDVKKNIPLDIIYFSDCCSLYGTMLVTRGAN